MEVRECKPAIISPSKFEAQLLGDLLRNAGTSDVCIFTDVSLSIDALLASRSNMVFVTEDGGGGALDWVRQLRRSAMHPLRKAPVFVVSGALTVALAERCRIAGANAIIGKPISSAVLSNTIRKVLAKPRPFVDGSNYVGPCRRAGIVTAGTGKHRRQTDPTIWKQGPPDSDIELRLECVLDSNDD